MLWHHLLAKYANIRIESLLKESLTDQQGDHGTCEETNKGVTGKANWPKGQRQSDPLWTNHPLRRVHLKFWIIYWTWSCSNNFHVIKLLYANTSISKYPSMSMFFIFTFCIAKSANQKRVSSHIKCNHGVACCVSAYLLCRHIPTKNCNFWQKIHEIPNGCNWLILKFDMLVRSYMSDLALLWGGRPCQSYIFRFITVFGFWSLVRWVGGWQKENLLHF